MWKAPIYRSGDVVHGATWAIAAVMATTLLGQPATSGDALVARAAPPVAEAAGKRAGIPVTSAERVSIRVPEYPTLSGEYRINDDETISFPVVGRLKVSQRTPAELETMIADAVSQRVGRQCQVTVEVVEYKPVFVNGYVSRAGAMPWKPGYTVMHAEALAGGAFRPSDNRSALPADNEKARANRAAADLARVLAHLARLNSERNGLAELKMPADMTKLVSPSEAKKLLAAQSTMLRSREAAFDAKLNSLERSRSLGQEEVSALKAQMARLDEQLKIRQEFARSIKALNIKGLVRFERTLEEQSRIANLEEKRTNVLVALARVHSGLATVVRELEVIKQERVASLDGEIIAMERNAAQYQIDVDAAKGAYRKLTGQNALSNGTARGNPTLSYEIIRSNNGVPQSIIAKSMTRLLPGDLLMVRLQEVPSQ